MTTKYELLPHIQANIRAALDEDLRTLSPALSREQERAIGKRDAVTFDGDLTAQLIPQHTQAHATIITRQ